MCHLLLRFLCLHEVAILALLVAILLTRFRSIFLEFLSICTLAIAIAELCSLRGEVPWNIVAVSRRALASLRVTTRTVSVSSVWFFRMHTRRFMGCQNAKFVKTSVSKPPALDLRFLKGSHLCFSVAPRRPLRPSVNPRPGVQMWSSRRWRASRRALPFLSLYHLSTCARVCQFNSCTITYILARRHATRFPSG